MLTQVTDLERGCPQKPLERMSSILYRSICMQIGVCIPSSAAFQVFFAYYFPHLPCTCTSFPTGLGLVWPALNWVRCLCHKAAGSLGPTLIKLLLAGAASGKKAKKALSVPRALAVFQECFAICCLLIYFQCPRIIVFDHFIQFDVCVCWKDSQTSSQRQSQECLPVFILRCTVWCSFTYSAVHLFTHTHTHKCVTTKNSIFMS